jgi:hypothetical protein
VAGLRDVLGDFRSRALFILDEAHHAAPFGGARYAISSQLTRAVRELSACFEHRLFLTATPHNGHSNSFSALLEMLDPQRFTRGVETRPKDLEPVMVRRLKADLRRLGEAFPERKVEAIPIADLPDDAPELVLWRQLAAYGELRARRIATLPALKKALAKLAFVGLQQRLLSSIAAFVRYSVRGIDFESSFQWGDADGGQVQAPGVPPSMAANIDKAEVGATVTAIEAMTDKQIRDLVDTSRLEPTEKTRIANGLIGRRGKVRDRMKAQGWLD